MGEKGKVFFALIFLSCSIRYIPTKEWKGISERVKDVEYSLEEVSGPTFEEPVFVLKAEARGVKVKRINQKYIVKEEVNRLLPAITFASGVFGFYLFNSAGNSVLARNFLLLSSVSSLWMLRYKKMDVLWREREIAKRVKVIPRRAFRVRLKGEEYETSFIPDRSGYVRINLLEFAPYYREGKGFEIEVYSPDGERVGEFSIDPEPISKRLLSLRLSKYPPEIEFTVSFDDSLGDRDFLLDAEEDARLVLHVRNKGKGIGRDLVVRITPLRDLPGLRVASSYTIDRIDSGEERRVVIPISGGRGLPTGVAELRVEILEPYFQADAEPVVIRFETRKFEPPYLTIYDKGVEEGEILVRKSANISLIIQNRGSGRAYDVRARIEVPSGITYLGESQEFNLGNLEPMEWRRIDFPVFVGARFREDTLRIGVRLSERREEFSKGIYVKFPLNQRIQKPKEIVIKGKEEKKEAYLPPPVLTVDVDIDIPDRGKVNPDAIGVIIANRRYDYAYDVEFAENDGRIIKEYFIKTFGIREENIIYFKDARKSDFERVFGTEQDYRGLLYQYVKENKSDVYIYYSGHGAPDVESKSAYFVPVDADPNFIRLNGYSLSTFYRNLSKVPARKIIVFIDACFSGASERGMLLARASPLSVVPVREMIPKNINVITSSQEDQISSWYEEKRHGLFTYFLLKGFQGDADRGRDGVISLRELYEYLKENVSHWAKRLEGRRQVPKMIGDGDVKVLEY